LRGKDHPQARLTEDQVRNIRARAKAGETYAEIASSFEVARPAISKIVTRQRWKHLD
jgi:transcriptional regulator